MVLQHPTIWQLKFYYCQLWGWCDIELQVKNSSVMIECISKTSSTASLDVSTRNGVLKCRLHGLSLRQTSVSPVILYSCLSTVSLDNTRFFRWKIYIFIFFACLEVGYYEQTVSEFFTLEWVDGQGNELVNIVINLFLET